MTSLIDKWDLLAEDPKIKSITFLHITASARIPHMNIEVPC